MRAGSRLSEFSTSMELPRRPLGGHSEISVSRQSLDLPFHISSTIGDSASGYPINATEFATATDNIEQIPPVISYAAMIAMIDNDSDQFSNPAFKEGHQKDQ